MAAQDLNAAKKKNPIDDNTANVVWEGFDVASWTVAGTKLSFPISRIEEDGGNRLVLRQRPYRKGVKIDSTGGKERVWNIASLFHNNLIDEPGLDESQPLYPNVLNQLLESFDRQETGDLVVPTAGRVRARAQVYKRIEDSSAERDAASLQLTFVEDNEDSVGANSVTRPTAKSSGKRVVTEAVFDAMQTGLWDGSLDELIDAMNQLQGILTLPETLLDDTLATAGVIRRNVEKLLTTFSDVGEESRSMFTDPSSSRLARKLFTILDMAGSAEGDAMRRRRATTTRSYATHRSIFEIAALEKQDASALLELNQYRIDDPMSIDAGTEVRIFV